MDCGACTEHCPTKALYTVPYIGRDGQEHRLPKLDPSLCIGCGACEHACPVTTEKPEERVRVGPCNLCEEKCEFKKREAVPPRAIVVRAVNPQQKAVKKFEEKAVDPVGDTDFPFCCGCSRAALGPCSFIRCFSWFVLLSGRRG